MYEDSVRDAEADQPHPNCKCSLTYDFTPTAAGLTPKSVSCRTPCIVSGMMESAISLLPRLHCRLRRGKGYTAARG